MIGLIQANGFCQQKSFKCDWTVTAYIMMSCIMRWRLWKRSWPLFAFISCVAWFCLLSTFEVNHDMRDEGDSDQLPWQLINSQPVVVQSNNIILDTQPCRSDVFLAIYTHSKADSIDRRSLIRSTWGKKDLYDIKVKIVFVMGTPSETDRMQVVKFESLKYDDIVQESFIDNHGNDSHKSLAGLRWVDRKCPRVKFVLKASDDVFVNMPALLNNLWRLDKTNQAKQLLMGKILSNVEPIRNGDPASAYVVSAEQYPPSKYPLYCSGLAFIMSIDVATAILSSAPTVPMVKIADVFISGLVPFKLGLQHTVLNYAYSSQQDKARCIEGKLWYKCLFIFIQDPDEFMSAWEGLILTSKVFTIPDSEVSRGKIAGWTPKDNIELPKVPQAVRMEIAEFLGAEEN